MIKKHLVIGLGEVGKAIQAILKCDGIDKHEEKRDEYEFIHICFPYNTMFKLQVDKYKKFYGAKYVVIHSTVPVGTSRELNAIHSFVTGRHPNLEEGIRTFTKFFGGNHSEEASKIFEEEGIKVKCYEDSETTEAMKLISTTYYGLNIMIEKEIFAWCQRNNLPFDAVYTENNNDYNEGYLKLGCPQYVRPNLKHVPGPLGGHCVGNNLSLIKDFPLAELLKRKNDEYKQK